jgi:hypothetical protein
MFVCLPVGEISFSLLLFSSITTNDLGDMALEGIGSSFLPQGFDLRPNFGLVLLVDFIKGLAGGFSKSFGVAGEVLVTFFGGFGLCGSFFGLNGDCGDNLFGLKCRFVGAKLGLAGGFGKLVLKTCLETGLTILAWCSFDFFAFATLLNLIGIGL